ncbi:MAG: Tn3 family transposase [Albidovulum sp.]|nr:Tn3 family transposase [Albidovulum sp.]
MKLKAAATSDIIRRLTPHSRQRSIYKAMKAFRQIIKAMFILRNADVVELQRAIERRLSKAEPANCFTQAAAVGIPRGLDHADRVEQEIAESRTRLIRNGIVRWKYLCMTRRLEARCCAY